MPPINFIQALPHPQYLRRVNRNVARLPEVSPARLVDHHAAMRQTVSVPLLPTAQQQRTHRRCLPDTHRVHRRVDVGHGIIDCEAGRDRAAGRVDVQRYRLRGRVGFEEEELRDDGRGEGVVHLAIEADDTLLEEFGEYVSCGG